MQSRVQYDLNPGTKRFHWILSSSSWYIVVYGLFERAPKIRQLPVLAVSADSLTDFRCLSSV